MPSYFSHCCPMPHTINTDLDDATNLVVLLPLSSLKHCRVTVVIRRTSETVIHFPHRLYKHVFQYQPLWNEDVCLPDTHSVIRIQTKNIADNKVIPSQCQRQRRFFFNKLCEYMSFISQVKPSGDSRFICQVIHTLQEGKVYFILNT